MGYALGVDLGTTYTAAAVSDGQHAEIVPLGDRSPQAPSVVYKHPDGTFRYGESAERHAATEPERIAREFKRRMGDKTPIFVAGTPMSAHACSKALLGWTIDQVVAGQGAPPDRVVVTCPANWGPYRRELMSQVTNLNADYPITVCTEPEAAALHFTSTRRLAEGQPVAVYDLGGGTFDAAVLRRDRAGGFSVLGAPAGLEQLGGVDFDEAVFERVVRGIDWDRVDPDDPDTVTGLARLRRDCTEAKEALSSETETTVPIMLDGRLTRMRLTRAEFSELIDPLVGDTVDILERVIRRSGVTTDELAAIVLVGGSSRIPLISERITRRLGRPAVLSTQPKLCVAMGAALLAASISPTVPATDAVPTPTSADPPEPPAPPVQPVVVESVAIAPVSPDTATATATATASHTDSDLTSRPTPAPPHHRKRRAVPIHALIAVGCAVIAAALMLVGQAAVPTGQTWNASYAVDAVGAPADAALTVTILGVPVANRVPVTAGAFQLNAGKIFLAGPTRGHITSTAGTQEVVLHADERWNRNRWLNLPFAALILVALFSFAYAESLLRPVRHRRTRATPGELIGLIGSGLGLGVAAVLATWVIGDRLPEVATALGITVFVCAAVGLLAFVWQRRDTSGG